MNSALKSWFLSLIDSNILDTYKNAADALNKNCSFIDCINWFTECYSTTNEGNDSKNKQQMEAI